MDRLRRVRDQWTLGVAVLVITGLFAVAAAMVAFLAVLGLAAVFKPNMSDAESDFWLLLTAPLWLPVAVGIAVPEIQTMLRRVERDREREQSTGNAGGI